MKQLLVFMLLLLASQLVAGPKKKMVAITLRHPSGGRRSRGRGGRRGLSGGHGAHP